MRSLVYISIIVLSLLSSVVSAKHVLVTRTRIPKRSTPQKPRPDSVIITDEAIAERMWEELSPELDSVQFWHQLGIEVDSIAPYAKRFIDEGIYCNKNLFSWNSSQRKRFESSMRNIGHFQDALLNDYTRISHIEFQVPHSYLYTLEFYSNKRKVATYRSHKTSNQAIGVLTDD